MCIIFACLGRGKGTKLQKKKLKTSIGNWLRYNRRRASLDESAKQLLSNLVVLAWILKYSVEEFSEYEIYNVPYKVDTTRERDCLKC